MRFEKTEKGRAHSARGQVKAFEEDTGNQYRPMRDREDE